MLGYCPFFIEREEDVKRIHHRFSDIPQSATIRRDGELVKFEPISYESNMDFIKEVIVPYARILSGINLSELKHISHYIRPLIDSEIEKEFYGLDFRGGINMEAIDQHFAQKSFDFIYGRHLGPDAFKSYIKSLEKFHIILIPGGSIIDPYRVS